MSSIIQAIGVVSGLLGIVQFGMDNFADKEGEGSTYKIAVGLDGTDGLENAGGNLPDVRVWNTNGDYVGMKSDPGNVDSGSLGEVHVEHDNQGVYTLFSANDDAICVAWATSTWTEDRGGNQYAIQGEMGYQCGASWFYSGMYYNGNEDEFGKPASEQAKCFWIDKNGDQPYTGFQVRWPAFSVSEVDPEAPESERDPKQKCDDISFGLRTEKDPVAINYWGRRKRNHLTAVPTKRNGLPPASGAIRRRSAGIASKLVVSDIEGHSARFVCESETSLGPDIANVYEKLFCDMDQKKLYNFCDENVTTDCFDIDAQKLVTAGSAGAMGAATEGMSTKTYGKTLDWRRNTETSV